MKRMRRQFRDNEKRNRKTNTQARERRCTDIDREKRREPDHG